MCLSLACVSGIFAWLTPCLAKAASARALRVIYKLEEKPAKCPEGTPPHDSCVWLTGKTLVSDATWPEMRRFAIVSAPGPALPPACDTATTSGVLYGKHGRVHFRGKGYYCPKTDIAWYRYTFDAAQARHHDMPEHGTIHDVGSSNSETFTSSLK